MADFGAPDLQVPVDELTDDEREWVTVAVENELARRGRLLATEPEPHATIIAHLTSAYRRLRDRH